MAKIEYVLVILGDNGMNKRYKPALLCVNMINDYVHPDGKATSLGMQQFIAEHNSIARIKRILEQFRRQNHLIIHTRTAFHHGYPEFPDDSVIFHDLDKKQALLEDTWGTEFLKGLEPERNEPVITKRRVGAFYHTDLDLILRAQGAEQLYIIGHSTQRTVLISACEAHDRDFHPVVIADGCVSSSDERNDIGLRLLKTYAEVKKFEEIAVRLAQI